MFIDKLILLNRAFLRAIEGRVKDTPDADLTLYVLDYLKYLGSLNAMRDGKNLEKGVKPRPVKVLMQLRKRKANDHSAEEKLDEESVQGLPERLSSQLNILRSKRSSVLRAETGSVYDEASSSKNPSNAAENGVDCIVDQTLSAVGEDSRFNLVQSSLRKRDNNDFETVISDAGVDLLLSKLTKQATASTSFAEADSEGLPLTFSFGTTANISSTTQFLFGKVGQEKKDDALAFVDGATALIDVSHSDILNAVAGVEKTEYECGFPIYERCYHNDVRKLPIHALFNESFSSEVCKNVPVVELDGSAKELSFLIAETVPISDLPVDNLGCWNSKAIHMKKRNYYFKDGILCTTEKEAADSFIERRQYNHAYAVPYRSIIKVIWSAHLLDGTHRRSLITYRIERGASVPLRPYHLSKKSDVTYPRVFHSALESITGCRQDLTPTEAMSQMLDQTAAAEEPVDTQTISRNKEQVYNRCSSKFSSSKFCGLLKRKDYEEDEISS